MDNKEAIQELRSIRSIMERSTRFQTINGWGVAVAGLLALAAAWVADGLFNGGSAGRFATLFGPTDYLWAHKTQVAVGGSLALLVICAVACTPVAKSRFNFLKDRSFALAQPLLVLLVLAACTAFIVDASYNPFLYFRF